MLRLLLLLHLQDLILFVGGYQKTRTGRSRFEYLRALATYQETTEPSCGKPTECSCHCDCPEAKLIDAPPVPPPCPIYPKYEIVPPTDIGGLLLDGNKASENTCKDGEIQRADGSCQVIDGTVINEMKAMVVAARDTLNAAQQKYKDLANNCKKCHKDLEQTRDALLIDHQDYKRKLDMLLGALARWRKPVEAEKEEEKGLEFDVASSLLENVGHVSCETWLSQNSTFVPTKSLCGVMCRAEENCIGFSMEKEKKFCILFDRFEKSDKAQSTEITACLANAEEKQYEKRWQKDMKDASIAALMHKIDGITEELETAILAADAQSLVAGGAFNTWAALDLANRADGAQTNEEIAGAKKLVEGLTKEKDHYGQELRKQNKLYFDIKDTAAILSQRIVEERKENPPFPPVVHQPPPKKLPWKDNPNSKDTQWSEHHPDCPQGPPCFCDCNCRPSPPQNFVRDMVAAFTPCPLPPPPPPPGSVVKWESMPPPPVLSR